MCCKKRILTLKTSRCIGELLFDKMIETKSNQILQRILPILTYCQANKGDLRLYEQWINQPGAGEKYFYAYYAGLFCRILCILDKYSFLRSFVRDCNELLDKYNWYEIQEADLKLCVSTECEVPDALEFIDGIDNVLWKGSGFGNGRDAVCLKMENSSWTFADVRGAIYAYISSGGKINEH